MRETGEKESSRNKLSFKKGLGFLPLPLFLNLFLNRLKKKEKPFPVFKFLETKTEEEKLHIGSF